MMRRRTSVIFSSSYSARSPRKRKTSSNRIQRKTDSLSSLTSAKATALFTVRTLQISLRKSSGAWTLLQENRQLLPLRLRQRRPSQSRPSPPRSSERTPNRRDHADSSASISVSPGRSCSGGRSGQTAHCAQERQHQRIVL